jgi:hypothetical protein
MQGRNYKELVNQPCLVSNSVMYDIQRNSKGLRNFCQRYEKYAPNWLKMTIKTSLQSHHFQINITSFSLFL